MHNSTLRIVIEDILEIKNTRSKILISLLKKGIIKSIGNTSNLKYILT